MRVSKTTNHGNVRWRATAYLNGKRRQRFFTSRDDARAWLDSIRTDHTGFWNGRTAEEQGEIVSAFKLASERGLSLHECVLSNNINGNPLPITDAINYYINVISQRSLRPSSLKQTRINLSQLAEEFAGRMCHDVSAGTSSSGSTNLNGSVPPSTASSLRSCGTSPNQRRRATSGSCSTAISMPSGSSR